MCTSPYYVTNAEQQKKTTISVIASNVDEFESPGYHDG